MEITNLERRYLLAMNDSLYVWHRELAVFLKVHPEPSENRGRTVGGIYNECCGVLRSLEQKGWVSHDVLFENGERIFRYRVTDAGRLKAKMEGEHGAR